MFYDFARATFNNVTVPRDHLRRFGGRTDMLLDFPALVGRQFSVYISHQQKVIGFHATESFRVTEALGFGSRVPNSAPTACRARDRRLMTVPMGISRTSAAS